MKQAKKILKYLGISTKAVVSFDDVDEVVKWSPDSVSGDQVSSQVTQLDDGFVVAKKTAHFKTPQRVPSTSDLVSNSDEVETLQLPIEVNVIIERPSSESKESGDTSLSNNWLDGEAHGGSSECRPDNVQQFKQITTEMVPAKRGRIRKWKRAVSKLLGRTSKSFRVPPSAKTDDVKNLRELNVETEAESSVCDAVKRLRQRRAMFYV